MTSALKARVDSLEKSILAELELLKPACPEQIRSVFEKSFDRVISELMKTELLGNVPAVPMITMPYLGIYGLAQMVKHNGNVCQVRLAPETITDTRESKMPLDLSWALDVEDGTKTLGKHFDLAGNEILQSNRLPLTVTGILNLGRGGVLSRHNVVATGSRLGDDGVALLWLSGGEPKLYWSWASFSDAEWGSASCGSRVGP